MVMSIIRFDFSQFIDAYLILYHEHCLYRNKIQLKTFCLGNKIFLKFFAEKNLDIFKMFSMYHNVPMSIIGIDFSPFTDASNFITNIAAFLCKDQNLYDFFLSWHNNKLINLIFLRCYHNWNANNHF